MENKINELVGAEVKKVRQKEDLTLEQMAKSLNFSKGRVNQWEHGMKMTDESAAKFAEVYGINPKEAALRIMEAKEMTLTIKPLSELKTLEEIESTVNEIVNTVTQKCDNQFVVKYILKRLFFVRIAELFIITKTFNACKDKLSLNFTWRNIIGEYWDEILSNNRLRESFSDKPSSATHLRKILSSKEKDLRYGFQGNADYSSLTYESPQKSSPLKGEDWEIARAGYYSLHDLQSVLPTEDNSIITTVVVCLNILTTLLWGIGYDFD